MKFRKIKSILLQVTLLIVTIFTTNLVNSQIWLENLPKDKAQNRTLTLQDYQKAFNDYWESFNVDNGYYVQNGEKFKAPYWKQFKRWEWYWECRVDPQTGAFPATSAAAEFKKYLLENPGGSRSPSGNWTSMGPTTSAGGYAGLGRLNCVAFRPGDINTIYVGAASGGIWKTLDGGSSWTPLGDNNAVLGVSDIIVINQVAGPDILYIATGDKDGGSVWSLGGQQSNDNNSVGVLKSTDGGITWNTTGLSFSASQKRTISRLIIDPNSAYQIIYAATSAGIYKTTDGGTSWPLQFSSTEHFIDMEMNPSNSSILYVSTVDYWGTPKIYYTTNGGTNWFTATTPFVSTDKRIDLAVTVANSAYVYAVVAKRNGGLSTVSRSTNTGVNFSTVYTGTATTNLLGWYADESGGTNGQGGYDLCIIASPTNDQEVYVGGVNTHKSTDGGSNWTCVSCWTSGSTYNNTNPQAPVVHADQHFLAYQNTSTLFICNDGGLYKTTNGGSSWTDRTNSMVISQLYRLGVGQASSSEVITGLQDNGTKIYSSGSWMDKIGGDGMECIVDYTNNNTQYGTLYFGDIYRTTNHWSSNTQITPPDPTNPPYYLKQGAWVTPYAIDPNVNTTIIAGYSDVYKTTNQGNGWSIISTNLTGTGGPDLRSVAIAPSNSSYIYVATLTSIWKTTVGGGTGNWTNITSNLPVGTSNITYISVNNTNPNTVWVSFGGYNTDGVWQTTNGGTSWTNISTGLPSLPTMCVIQNMQNTGQVELYAGTDAGVYVKVGGTNWIPFFTGLPNVVVTELDIYYDATPANSRLRAATFGRGLWESDLYSVTAAPVADFSADNLTPTIIETVNFTDLSTNTPTSWVWSFTPGTITYLGGTNAGSQNPQVQFDVPGAYTVALMATNAGGSHTETKIDYIIATHPAPLADFTADNLSPTTIDIVSFTDLSTNFPDTWLWAFSPSTVGYMDGTDQNSQNPKVLFDNVGLYTVALTATNAGGSHTETKVDYINVREALSVTVSASPDEICYGETAQLFATPSGGTGTYTYSWTSNPSGFNSSEQNPDVSPVQTTVYTVEVDDGEHIVGADVEITVHQLPIITLGNWPDQLCNEQEPPVQLTAAPAGGIFSGNNVTSGGLFSPEQAPLGWNVITYTYEDNNGCESSEQDSIYVDDCVGINNKLSGDRSVLVYPNPNKGVFTIKSDNSINKVEIVNMTGKIVFTKKYDETQINLNTQLVEGIYIIHIFTTNKQNTSQIIKREIVVN